MKQQYKKGESLAVGTKVKLTLGKKESSTTAAEKVEVPALVNYTEKKAEQEEEFSRLGYLEQFYQGQ